MLLRELLLLFVGGRTCYVVYAICRACCVVYAICCACYVVYPTCRACCRLLHVSDLTNLAVISDFQILAAVSKDGFSSLMLDLHACRQTLFNDGFSSQALLVSELHHEEAKQGLLHFMIACCTQLSYIR